MTNFVFTTPGLAGHAELLRQTLGGWEVSGIYTLQSGLPFSIYGGGNASGSDQGGDRDDYAPGFNRLSDFGLHQGSKAQWLNSYFNPAAFSRTGNAPGTFGNTPRNLFQGPGINTADGGIFKNWTYRERYALQFRWEMFNVFNHASFANPNNNPLNSGFGQITSIGPIAPRVQQAALKLTF